MSRLFDELDRERASGDVMTYRRWAAQRPVQGLAQTLAGVARRAMSDEVFMHAVREFLDEFSLRTTSDLRAEAIVDEPPLIGHRPDDAYLAALAEHLATQASIDVPRWAGARSRWLDTFWFASDEPAFRALLIAESPAAFRRRGLFISARSLERV